MSHFQAGLAVMLLMLLAASVSARAQDYDLTADEIFYDEQSGSFRAIGNIVLVYQQKTVTADRVFYDQAKQTVRVSGNVIFQDADKAVTLFAHRMAFDRHLNRHEIESISLRFKGDSRLRANYFNAEHEHKSELHDVVYSPCRECQTRDGQAKAPLWQIRSRKTVMDSARKTLTHRQLYFDVRGKTVFALPTLRHVYDSSVGLSGILPPIIGTNTVHQSFYAQGFYYRFSNRHDMTLVPVYSHLGRHYFSAQYRRALSRGSIESHVTIGGGGDFQESTQSILRSDDRFGQAPLFARVKFDNQLDKQTRIRGNVNYLGHRDFLNYYRQNTNFNQHGVGAPDFYQDDFRMERFIGRDYIKLETRYRHRIALNKYYTFPLAQLQYHGGIYHLWGGYVSAYGELEELQRTAIERKGRTRMTLRADYRKDFWLGNKTKLEFAGKYRGLQMHERGQILFEEKNAHRSIQHYYGRITQDFSHVGRNYILGFAPQIMAHGSKGEPDNALFVNEDSTEYIPDVASLLAFQPLGNGEDIQQAGRRDAAAGRIYYRHTGGFAAELGYARARVTHHDEVTQNVLQIESGKTDHAAVVLFSYQGFRFQEDVLLEKQDKTLLAAAGVAEMSLQKWTFSLHHDYLNQTLFLSDAERELKRRQSQEDEINETANLSIDFRPSDVWRFSVKSLYDMREKQFKEKAGFEIIRHGDCVNLALQMARDYDDPKNPEDTVTFSLSITN